MDIWRTFEKINWRLKMKYFYVTNSGVVYVCEDLMQNYIPVQSYNPIQELISDKNYQEISVNTAQLMGWPV